MHKKNTALKLPSFMKS